jgi:hypothetical protein
MGVLACDRKNCDRIMCDRYSIEYGYICDTCFDELVDSGKDVAEFMDTEFNPNMVTKKEVRAKYESIFSQD